MTASCDNVAVYSAQGRTMILHRIRLTTRITSVMLGTVLLAGCATRQSELPVSRYPVADITVVQAQRDDTLPLLDDLATARTDISSDVETVRWGGTIAHVSNLADQQTLVEVVSRPLQSNGRPLHNDQTAGRFVALVDEFLDPQIVVKGRDITVTGVLAGRQAGKVGKSDYLYPFINVENYTYWKKQIVVPPRHFPHWNNCSAFYNDPFYGPGPLHRPPPRPRQGS